MSKIAIRDDDTCYWTDVDVLDRTVGRLWRAGAAVSLAIIPNAVQFETPWDRAKFAQGAERRPLGANAELTAFLRELIREGRITPILHGIDHRYAYRGHDGRPKIPVGRVGSGSGRSLIGEFVWKRPTAVEAELNEWLAYLCDLLGYKITIFAPPGNAISRQNARVVYRCGLDICGAVASRSFNRPPSVAAFRNYVLNAAWRVLAGGHYPYALRYGRRLDRPAYATPTPEKLAALSKLYTGPRSATDLIVATHWYDFERSPTLADDILRFIDRTGRTPSPVEATFET